MTRAVFLLALTCALASREGLAWNQGTHVAVIEAARRISPAFAARFAGTDLEALRRGASEADRGDLDCASHRGDREDLEAWKQAARILKELRAPRPNRTARTEAFLVGQFLHYVADCAAPRIATGQRSGALHAGTADIVIFREKRPLTEPLEAALRQRAEEAFWADAVVAAAPRGLRDAVNMTIDAAALFPARSGASTAEDRGPALFWISSMMSFGTPQNPASFLTDDDPAHRKWAETLINAGPKGESKVFAELIARGVHVVEWVPRTEPNGTRVRALLFNNQGTCSRGIRLEGSSWRFPVPSPVPAFSLKAFELQVPTASPSVVRVRALRGVCSEETGEAAFSALSSVVYRGWIFNFRPTGAAVGSGPLPEGQEVQIAVAPSAARAFDVVFDPDEVEKVLKVLRVESFVARDARNAWSFEIEGSTAPGAHWRLLSMVFRVEISDSSAPSAPPVEKVISVVPEISTPRPSFTVSVPEQTSRFQRPRFRLVSVKLE